MVVPAVAALMAVGMELNGLPDEPLPPLAAPASTNSAAPETGAAGAMLATEPEKRGRSASELPSTVRHDVCLIVFVISRRPPASDHLVEGQSQIVLRHCSVDARHVHGCGFPE